jgi:hypothetical protein
MTNQVIPEAAVEAAARMLAETCDPLGDWDKQGESYRWIYRRRIMPALQAAAPHMLAEAWQEGWAHYRKYFSPEFPELGNNPYRSKP